MSKYANTTSIDVAKTRGHIEAILGQYGATAFAFATQSNESMISFQIGGKTFKFILSEPPREQFEFTATGRSRGRAGAEQAHKQARRQVWRALFLIIKAKLVGVDEGITTIEREFLADMVVRSTGETVGQLAIEQMKLAEQNGTAPRIEFFSNGN